MNKPKKRVVIIGNGISGITCARHIRKKDGNAEILVISGETDHFFSRTALMYIYMGHMKYEHTKPYEDWFWEKNNILLKKAWINTIDFERRILKSADEEISYDILILATGSKPNKFGWVGQDLEGVQGLYSYQDLELMEKNTKGIRNAVVVGGGLIGIEMAEMLRTRNIPVTFLVREESFWDNVLPTEESNLVNRHIREHHIDLKLRTELDEIIGDQNGRVKAVRTKNGEVLEAQFVGLTAGVSPNIEFLKNSDLEINRGVLVDSYFKTNIEDVYAIGDCAEFYNPPAEDRKNIEQVWYTGRMHGETLAYNLTSGNPVPYKPGIWFNSAKFLDIEYQTYGQVPSSWGEAISSFYWEDKGGKACLRILFSKADKSILGINGFGWRLRHEFFDKAISEKWPLEKVILNLHKGNFNTEFHKNFHELVLNQYNLQFGKNLQVKKSSFLQKILGSRA
jgi:NADPH-dependent 2,4-dienoyl-CoA reductase/sulfur reductase-like enzyme